MPTYEYECNDCGHRVELFQRLSEDPLTTCDVCGGTLRKLFHPVGISFKGSGFYTTDSRSGSSKSAPTKSSDKDGATKPKKDSGTEKSAAS